MKRFKYRLNKLFFLTQILFERIILEIYYYFYPNKSLETIIYKNRIFLETIEKFLPYNIYLENDYGVQKRIYDKLEDEIIDFPTYSDLLSFFIKNITADRVNYLEIGVSVLKNYLQINNNVENSDIVAFDINDVNPNFNDLKKIEKNNNNLFYFKGSVLNKTDAENFKIFYKNKFDIVFSDALHEPDAVRSEFELIIKNNLKKEFLIYYDDLDFPGLENELYSIKSQLENSINREVNFYTFKIYGWIGQNEKLHKNGIITTYDLQKVLDEKNIKIFNFKKA